MNRNDIIRMAREAGIDAEKDTLCRYEGWVEPIERFAALVAAAEREECAKLCEEHWRNGGNAMECADAIRARGKK